MLNVLYFHLKGNKTNVTQWEFFNLLTHIIYVLERTNLPLVYAFILKISL